MDILIGWKGIEKVVVERRFFELLELFPDLPAGDKEAYQRLSLTDFKDVSQARFMESYEAKHSNQSFTSRLAKKLGVTKPPLRLDSQTKYGKCPNARVKLALFKRPTW